MSAKRRVVHLIGTLETGGCEQMLLRTLPRLQDETFAHEVVTLFASGSLRGQFEDRGVPVRAIGLRSPVRLLGGTVRDAVRRRKPSLVLTYLAHADLAGRLLGRRFEVPVLPFLRTTYNAGRYLPARMFERLTAPRVRHYLANSEAVAGYYAQSYRIPRERFTVIPNGIDLAVFDEADPAPIREELRLGDDGLLVICVANLARNKGHRFLLEAFDRIAATWPTAQLALVGEGAERQALEAQRLSVASRSRIHLLGRRADVPALLRASAVFALPTQFEGMSNAVQEAMAARLPVVTTDIPENRALISHERTGLLAPVGDVVALSSSLHRLLGDSLLRRQLGDAARSAIEVRFAMPVAITQWQSMLARWVEV